ncbi:MAG: hypothetical protein NC830_04200, partial [Candidatus Omnitrophica bacterium]|nr:hypothetical protein [Candidatus Omnitrophota bacterium]
MAGIDEIVFFINSLDIFLEAFWIMMSLKNLASFSFRLQDWQYWHLSVVVIYFKTFPVNQTQRGKG